MIYYHKNIYIYQSKLELWIQQCSSSLPYPLIFMSVIVMVLVVMKGFGRGQCTLKLGIIVEHTSNEDVEPLWIYHRRVYIP